MVVSYPVLNHINAVKGGEKMTDKELLEQAIERSGVKVAKIMEAANIKSYATFRGRLNNETEFTASTDMKKISILIVRTALRIG